MRSSMAFALLAAATMAFAGCTGGTTATSTDPPGSQTSDGPNRGPLASFVIKSSSGLQVSVDASASVDSDGTIVSYAWAWGDGQTAVSDKTAIHVFPFAGAYIITLTVTDNDGSTSTATRQVTVPMGTATGTPTSTATTTTSTSTSTSATSSTSTSSTSSTSTQSDLMAPDITAYTFAVMGPNSLRANWTVYDESAVSSKIEYQKAADFGTAPMLYAGQQSTEGDKSFTITGLTACTAYKARIVATDAYNQQSISDTLTATTNGSSPTITPSSPMAINVMHDRFTVSYTVAGTSDVTSKVLFGLTSSYSNQVVASAGPGLKTVTITGLTPDTNYNFIIQASSPCGFTEGPGVNNVQKTAKLVHVDILANGGATTSFCPGSTTGCVGTGTTPPSCPGGAPTGALCVAAGQPLVFEIKNIHTATHSWRINGVTPAYSTGNINTGATVVQPASITLTAGTTYTMQCGIHTSMTGQIYAS